MRWKRRLQEWWLNFCSRHFFIFCARCGFLIREDECGMYECKTCGWLGDVMIFRGYKQAKQFQDRIDSYKQKEEASSLLIQNSDDLDELSRITDIPKHVFNGTKPGK